MGFIGYFNISNKLNFWREFMDYIPILNFGEFLGHGIADNGKIYEGYEIDGKIQYFYVDNCKEILEADK